MVTDEILLEKVKTGDQKALEQLFERYFFSLCRFASSFVKQTDIAEEIVSDVFLNIWLKRNELNIHTNIKAYLFVAIKNQALNYLNKEKLVFEELSVNTEAQDITLNEGSSIELSETREEINAIIKELPPQRQVIFKMNKYEGLKYKEIADKLSISVNTVQKQMIEAVKFVSQYRSQFYSILLLFVMLT